MPVSHIGHTVPLCGDSRLELVLQQQELPHAHIETFPPKSPLALIIGCLILYMTVVIALDILSKTPIIDG
jgi:hypothetical protein